MHLKYLLFLTIFISKLSFAGYDMNERCREAYTDIINLRFDKGEKLLSLEEKLNPDNDITVLIRNYIDFLSSIISENTPVFEKYKDNIRKRIKRLEKGDQSSPYYLYCIAEIYFQSGVTKIKFNEYLTGIYDLNKAYKLLKNNKDKFPLFKPNLKDLGLLHIIIGAVKENFKWFGSLLPDNASKEEGMKELHEILEHCMHDDDLEYLQTETLLIYSYSVRILTGDEKSIKDMSSYYNNPAFKNELKENPLLIYSLGSTLMSLRENDKAIKLINSYKPAEGTYPFYYLDYLLAKAKLNRLDIDSYKYLFRFIQNFEGKYYIKTAYQHLAWYYLIKGSRDKYLEYISKVRNNGTNIIEADKLAEREAKNSIIPNVELLKARLLFDGGYCSEAIYTLDMLDSSSNLRSHSDSLEFIYRRARVMDCLKRQPEAIDLYRKTLELGKDDNYYFAANSALKLAEIYEDQDNLNKAEYYYRVCLSLDFDDYHESIIRKAKQGLTRLKLKT